MWLPRRVCGLWPAFLFACAPAAPSSVSGVASPVRSAHPAATGSATTANADEDSSPTAALRVNVSSNGGCISDVSRTVCWRGRDAPVEVARQPVRAAFVGSQGQACIVDKNGALACRSIASDAPPHFEPVASSQRLSSVAGVADHQCGISAERNVLCWGDNRRGQTSDDAESVTSTPKPVAGLAGVDQVVAGRGFSCALRGTEVLCWGSALFGQRGTTPKQLKLPPIKQLSAGEDGACALDTKSNVWCWDQTLDKPKALASAPAGVTAIAGDVCALAGGKVHCAGKLGSGVRATLGGESEWLVVGAIDDARVLAATDRVGCAVNGDGELRCFGDAEQIPGTTIRFEHAVRVPGIDDAVQLAVGGATSCALRDKGVLWCWGNHQSRPRRIGRLPAGVVRAAVGLGESCALTQGGELYCWRDGDEGWDDAEKVTQLRDVKAISMGYLLGCVLTQAGAASCWETRALPPAGTVSADAAKTLTGLTQGQQLVGVGEDWLCVAGTGGLQCRTSADRRLQVVRGAPPPYAQLCVGNVGACVRDAAGQVFCWDRGEDAKRWTGIGPVRDLDCDFEACVVLADGHVACGGPGARKLIKGVDRARQVGMGFDHGCALRDDGSVWCWGDRKLGSLGAGKPAVIAQAVEVGW